VVRQHDPGVDTEGSRRACDINGSTQGVDVSHQQVTASIQQVDRKEVGASGRAQAMVIGHGGIIAARADCVSRTRGHAAVGNGVGWNRAAGSTDMASDGGTAARSALRLTLFMQ